MIEIPGDQVIHVEVVPHPGAAGDLSPSDLVDRFSGRVTELGHALAAVAGELRASLESQLVEPANGAWELDEVSLEMSINLEAEIGVIISRAKSGAAFQATLKWSRRDCVEAAGQASSTGSDAVQPAR